MGWLCRCPGNLSGNELSRKLSGNIRPQSSQLAEQLEWNLCTRSYLHFNTKTKTKEGRRGIMVEPSPQTLASEEKASTSLYFRSNHFVEISVDLYFHFYIHHIDLFMYQHAIHLCFNNTWFIDCSSGCLHTCLLGLKVWLVYVRTKYIKYDYRSILHFSFRNQTLCPKFGN